MDEYIKREDVLAKVQSVSFEYYDRFSGDVISHEKVKAVLEKDILKIPVADVVPASVFRDCRNELCQKCGAYTQKHLGACDGCRWREMNG